MTLNFLNDTPTTTIFLHLREMGLLTSAATTSAATGQSAQVAQHTAFKMENRVLNMFVFLRTLSTPTSEGWGCLTLS